MTKLNIHLYGNLFKETCEKKESNFCINKIKKNYKRLYNHLNQNVLHFTLIINLLSNCNYSKCWTAL